MNPMELSPAPATGKVFGAPLQHLYRRLLQLPQSPRQPELIRTLTQSLADQGLAYHPRTIKRQLLGNIEYIPEPLEHTLVEWVRAKLHHGQRALLEKFAQEKSQVEASQDRSLYIPPQSLTRMADAYLYLHKNLSRRQLALRLASSLEKHDIHIGLETLQAALGGKMQKVRKVLAEELKSYFSEEGYSTPQALETILEKVESEGKQEVLKVGVGEAARWADAYLLKHPGLSKRQLALALQTRLEAKGYHYHLSSIQAVLEGKTHKTRKVILDTLEALLQSEGIDLADLAGLSRESSGPVLEWNRYVSAETISDAVGKLLAQDPQLTRRRIALQLQADLRENNFDLSLSTLQYLLAGKTQRVKKIIADLLESYSQNPDFAAGLAPVVRAGRQSLQKRVEETRARMLAAPETEREAFRRHFLTARRELIRRVSERRSNPAPSGRRRGTKSFDELETVADNFDATPDNGEISISYDVKENLDRMSYG
ncbi:MAG TPA: hypothetical protein DF383_06270 [Deltaproteobacteria bacterium]|nr:hypothetical protein [Deltaproteobacteria bacterium]